MPEVWIDRRLPDDLRDQTGSPADVQAPQAEPSYYDVSMLQAPVWEGSFVGPYFFLGGLSGGAFLLAKAAELFGGKRYREVAQAGSTVALLAALPCPPLLIKDLGDPSRFHHMLRVFKPHSPMNLGSWTLTGYSALAAAEVFRQWQRQRSGPPRTTAARTLDRTLAVVTTAAGMPLALLMTCYTGVVLSGAATPVWTQNKWLAPLFAASAIGNGAGAISLALELIHRERWFDRETPGENALKKIDTAAHVAEAILLVQYLASLGRLSKPLTAGRQMKWIAGSAAALIGGELLKHASPPGRAGRAARIVGSILNLASGLALKYAILEAGKPSAQDPDAARRSSSRNRPQALRTAPRRTPFPASQAQPPAGSGPSHVLTL